MKLALMTLLACTGEDAPVSTTPQDSEPSGSVDVEQVPGQTGTDTSSDLVFNPDQVREYAITMTAQDWAALQDDPAAEQWFPAELAFQGETFADVSIRYKGSYGSLFWCVDSSGELTPGGALGDQPCSKLSMKLSFNEVDPEGRFHGVKKLSFNSMDADASRMRERLGYTLFALNDVPGPRAVHAWLTVNDEPQGLFTLVETIDGRMTRAHFPDEGGEGNVYKEVWPIDSTEQDWSQGLETNEDEDPDHEPMLAFSRDLEGAIAAGDAESLLAALDTWTDRDAFFRFLAVDRAMENWDGIMAWYGSRNVYNHNYYWYLESSGTRAWLLPWDLDRSLVSPNPIVSDYGMPRWDQDPGDCGVVTVFRGVSARAPSCDPFIGALADQGWDAYAAASQVLLAEVMTAEVVEDLLATWEIQVAADVARDPHGPTVQEWEQAMADLRDDVAILRAEIDAATQAR
jgi:spore coat protein H